MLDVYTVRTRDVLSAVQVAQVINCHQLNIIELPLEGAGY